MSEDLLLNVRRTPVAGDHPLRDLGCVGRADQLDLLRLRTAHVQHGDGRDDRVDIILLQDLRHGLNVGVVNGDYPSLELRF